MSWRHMVRNQHCKLVSVNFKLEERLRTRRASLYASYRDRVSHIAMLYTQATIQGATMSPVFGMNCGMNHVSRL